MKLKTNNRKSARGIALPIVMLVIIVLSAMVGGFLYSMQVEMRLAKNDNYDADLEWIARGSLEWARFAICQKCSGQPNIDALNQPWAGGTGCTNDPLTAVGLDLKNIPFGPNAHACVTITDMERKWNINYLANPRNPLPAILQQSLNVMGMTDATLASTIIDSICDWVDTDDDRHFSGAEGDYYMHLTPPYFCKDGFIDDLSEMLLIKGVSPEMYSASNNTMAAYQMRAVGAFGQDRLPPSYAAHFDELFTTMGRGPINVNTASALTLQMIPGVDAETAANIVKTRAGEDGIDGTDDDMPFQSPGQVNGRNIPGMPMGPGAMPLQNFIDVRSFYFDVKIEAEVNEVKRTYHAVLHRILSKPNDPQIVKFYWE